MKIVIRVDASSYIGSGHVMRCLVLAEVLVGRHHEVVFVCRPQNGDLIEFIKQKHFSVIPLPLIPSITPQHSSDYQGWLQTSNEQDAMDFVALVQSADLVVIDHYGIDSNWEEKIQQQLQCKIMAIDDLNRAHNADLILDQNLWPNLQNRYSQSHSEKLLGPEFALLRPSFAELSSHLPKKKNQVLAFFGGSDPTNECVKFAKALDKFEQIPFKIKLVAGGLNSSYLELKQYESGTLEVYKVIDKFDMEMAQSKYCFGASGVSNWERFCLKLPTTIVAVADNQIELSKYLSALNAVRYLGLGSSTTSENYRQEMEFIISHWDAIHYPGFVNVDGLGASRVAHTIEAICDEV